MFRSGRLLGNDLVNVTYASNLAGLSEYEEALKLEAVLQIKKKYLILESAMIYWNFKNIIRDVNDTVENALVSGQNIFKLSHGYWTLEDIQREFKSKGITLIGNYHYGSHALKSEKDVKMRKLRVLLGFDKTKIFTKGVWHHSGEVNINHRLKYIKYQLT